MSRNNAGLVRISKRGNVKPVNGGRTIVQELNYANNQTFQWYSGYSTLNIAPSQVFTAAEFPWRQAAVAISISGLEELQNSGEEAIIDLLESRVANGEDTFMNGCCLMAILKLGETGNLSKETIPYQAVDVTSI